MANAPAYLLRFVQYTDLMLLFGLPLFACFRQRVIRRHPRGRCGIAVRGLQYVLLVLAMLALVLGVAEFAFKTVELTGTSLSALDLAALCWYGGETGAGRAGLVRLLVAGAIAAFLCARLLHRNHEADAALPALSVLGGLALLTLVWNGHAAAGEGIEGQVRLVAGMAHLLAAGAWVGAIAGFGLMLLRRAPASVAVDRLGHVQEALRAFSGPGSWYVGVLVVTGVLHYGGLTQWTVASLPHTDYGRLMTLKLGMFAMMVGLAMIHRWKLVPRLELALARGEGSKAADRLRVSVLVEATIAVLIIAIVALLGTLNPHT